VGGQTPTLKNPSSSGTTWSTRARPPHCRSPRSRPRSAARSRSRLLRRRRRRPRPRSRRRPRWARSSCAAVPRSPRRTTPCSPPAARRDRCSRCAPRRRRGPAR
jgi:hypothetical protein